jgi:hypothetical protein
MNTNQLERKNIYCLVTGNMFSEYKKVGIEIKQNTYEKFVYVGNHLEALSSGNLKNQLSFKGIKLAVSG